MDFRALLRDQPSGHTSDESSRLAHRQGPLLREMRGVEVDGRAKKPLAVKIHEAAAGPLLAQEDGREFAVLPVVLRHSGPSVPLEI